MAEREATDGHRPGIAEQLEHPARMAATIIGRACAPGDWMVLVSGVIGADGTSSVGWEWFWRPPSDRTPDHGPVRLDSGPAA